MSNLDTKIQDKQELGTNLGNPNKIRKDAQRFKANKKLLVRSQASRLRELQGSSRIWSK